ncbi:MAG: DUF6883 domain-containing protein [Cyanobacteria bacterium P01_A01_bin.135]
MRGVDAKLKIPEDAIIPDGKVTRYLLVRRARNDKSQFLRQAGFTQENSEKLVAAIRALASAGCTVSDRRNEYGVFYQVSGELIGTGGRTLSVVTIWLQRQADGRFQFVTLKPKESQK